MINDIIDKIRNSYGGKLMLGFDELLERTIFKDSKGNEISKDIIKDFIKKYKDEIKEEFTLIINEFDDKVIPISEENNEIQLENFRACLITINDNCGISLACDLPSYDCMAEIYFYIVSQKWQKYKKQKLLVYYDKKDGTKPKQWNVSNYVWYQIKQ